MATRRTLAVFLGVALAGCGGGGGDQPLTSVKAVGGAGRAGPGGIGGLVLVDAIGGAIAVEASGALPAAPAWTHVAPSLGSNPRIVTGTLSLTAIGGAILGDDGVFPASGLRVAAGATLTLQPDFDADGTAGPDQVTLYLPNALVVEGTLKLGSGNGGARMSSLRATLGALDVRPGGALLAAGADGSAADPGQAGGSIELTVQRGVTVQGTIDAHGGRGSAGGQGGNLYINKASGDLVLSGRVDTSGGEGLSLGGGMGGPLRVEAIGTRYACRTLISGEVVTRGGDGATRGGMGGLISLQGCSAGEYHAAARVDASGGDATAAGPGGPAASEITFLSGCSRMVVGGRIVANGGAGAGTDPAAQGGQGGGVHVDGSPFTSSSGDDAFVVLGAEVDVSGGAGSVGGGAGMVRLFNAPAPTGRSGATLLASGGVDLHGGDGTVLGGTGGHAQLTAHAGPDAVSNGRIGGISLAVPFELSGGAASAGTGGAGGVLYAKTQPGLPTDLDLPLATRKLSLSAPVRAVGGAGSTVGGQGGTVDLFEHVALEVTAPLELSGGAGGTGPGGTGGLALLACDGSAKAGPITADGGAATTNGGTGGHVDLRGGGAAPAVRTGVLSVRGGAAATPGTPGSVVVDGALATLTDGQLRP